MAAATQLADVRDVAITQTHTLGLKQ
jgi:hypothetical protein